MFPFIVFLIYFDNYLKNQLAFVVDFIGSSFMHNDTNDRGSRNEKEYCKISPSFR